ncbi:MAG: hypothetical protein NDI75_02075 [Candidatus Didemnitutus sp.]|jgi:hypothetical protein|nr:hypothetical protein [Candidatus Didemnitutus sp.]
MIRPTSLARLFSALFAFALLAAAIPASAAVTDEQLAAAVAKLEKAGVVTDASYWLANAKRNQTCAGEKVGALIIAGAKRQGGKAGDLDGALKHLVRRRVITKTEYWETNAVAGKACAGGQVGSLISRLASTTK